MALTRSTSIEAISTIVNFNTGSLTDADGNDVVSSSGEKTESSTSSSLEYDKVSGISNISSAITELRANRSDYASKLAAIKTFAKGPESVGMSYLASLFGLLSLPLEVDCDKEGTSSERIETSIGVDAANSLSECTTIDVVASLEAAKKTKSGAVVIAGIKHYVDSKDLTTALRISKMYDQLPDINSKQAGRAAGFLDIEAELALVDRISSESLRIGVPDMGQTLADNASEPTITKRIWLGQLRQSCIRSYMGNIQSAIDECGVTACISKVPDAVSLILQYYQYRGNTNGLYAELTKVKGILNQLSPGWHITESEGVTSHSLDPFLSMSSDAKDLFLLDDELMLNVLAASHYGNEDYFTLAKTMYPFIYLQ